MTTHDMSIIAAFFVYMLAMMSIGIMYYRKTQSMSDYILGGRGLNAWVTSMSAEASDMSGWMLMGLPGFAYASGTQAIWIALGLILGTYLNWVYIAKRLRIYTEMANDSLTLPDFFQNRFRDTSQILRVVSAIFIFIFFLIYTSSGFVASGKLFNTVFGLPYFYSLLVGAAVVVFYTFLGGFMAVCWTDFVQGVLMFFAILIVPIAGVAALGGPAPTLSSLSTLNQEFLNPFHNADGTSISVIAIISMLAWGLGYFGQPHILVRFMAIKSSSELKQATRIAMTWVIISLMAAVMVGIVGKIYLSTPLTGAAVETVFMIMSNDLFVSFIAGIVLSAILAAIMSTASSQLLVTASAISQDFYKALINKQASEAELVRISRLTVLTIAIIAIIMALDPNNLVLDLVAYAWAGFGASFGPVLIFSLFWKRMTRNGALAGIIIGGITVLVWQHFAWFKLYEIVPGFMFASIAIIIVSLLDNPPPQEITEEFERVNQSNI